MDFFGAQQRARRNTGWLVALFAVAVVAIVLVIYLALLVVLGLAGGRGGLWQPGPFAAIAGGTLLIVACGAALRRFQLRAGGPAVAQLLGGRRLTGGGLRLEERTLHNVVEEMAIASGVPMPEVWVLDDEPGINAFAAGLGTGDAVVAVTRGTLEQLNRDQLQGVVAHEFSHILSADMRLNLRLMATLFGITCIATAGYVIMRSARGAGSSRKGGAAQVFAAGLVLYVLGSLGRLFASIIKAAVSRQREYHADAAAVQFTRNPRGIAGALRKIGATSGGGRVQHAQAAEASHLFFSEALVRHFSGWLATHPPIERRIAAIEPLFARYPEPEAARRAVPAAAAASAGPRAAGALPGIPGLPLPGGPATGAVLALEPQDIVGAIGTVDGTRLAASQAWLAALAPEIRRATADAFGATALVYCLLLDPDPAVRARQLTLLAQNTDASTHAETLGLLRQVESIRTEDRLPLVDLALPALRTMSREQHARFERNLPALVAADEQVTMFEFALGRVLRRHLTAAFARVRAPRPAHATLLPLLTECGVFLSALAWASPDAAGANASFAAGVALLPARPGSTRPTLAPVERCGPAALGPVLDRLELLAPRAKAQLVRAAATVVAHDGRTTVREFELLRALADGLDVPVPPLALPA